MTSEGMRRREFKKGREAIFERVGGASDDVVHLFWEFG